MLRGQRGMALPALVRYSQAMSANVQIEVDEQTASVLQTRAAQLGVTVPELVAELAVMDSEPVSVEDNEIAELDRRWNRIQSGGELVPQKQIVGWLRTWGTQRFKPWRNQ